MNQLADAVTASLAAKHGGPSAYAALRWQAAFGQGDTDEPLTDLTEPWARGILTAIEADA